MKRVILESPFAGDVETHVKYAHRCIADSLSRGEAPFASHILYTGALDDDDAAQRLLGIAAGNVWRDVAHATVVYCDYHNGLTEGTKIGIKAADAIGQPIEYRVIGKNPENA